MTDSVFEQITGIYQDPSSRPVFNERALHAKYDELDRTINEIETVMSPEIVDDVKGWLLLIQEQFVSLLNSDDTLTRDEIFRNWRLEVSQSPFPKNNYHERLQRNIQEITHHHAPLANQVETNTFERVDHHLNNIIFAYDPYYVLVHGTVEKIKNQTTYDEAIVKNLQFKLVKYVCSAINYIHEMVAHLKKITSNKTAIIQRNGILPSDYLPTEDNTLAA